MKPVLTPEIIYRLWCEIYQENSGIREIKTFGILKSTIREAINEDADGQLFWKIFETYYMNSKKLDEDKKKDKQILLDLGSELDRE